MSVEEFPTTSLKKSTKTESIPVHVSLVVSTIYQFAAVGSVVGFELVGFVIFELEDQV